MEHGTPRSRSAARGDVPTGRGAGAGTDLEKLLVGVGEGDESAFAELYDAVAGRVFGLALRLLGDRGPAEEVAQEVLLEVWRTAPRFDAARGNAVGWILMLTHRRAVDRVRATSARRARERSDAAARRVQPAVDDDVMLAADHDELSDALRALTAAQREAIVLAFFEGHTYREVAEILDVPEGTAKSRLRDGIRRLRTRLEGRS